VTNGLRDPRRVGFLVAAALALAILAVGTVFVLNGSWAGPILVFVGVVAVMVGPVTGWRLGPAAVAGSPADWPHRGVLMLLGMLAVVGMAYVAVAVVLNPVDGGAVNNAGYVAYGLLWVAIYAVVLTFAVGVPLGAVWVRVVRRLARSPARLVA
jgi:hypothetical protein